MGTSSSNGNQEAGKRTPAQGVRTPPVKASKPDHSTAQALACTALRKHYGTIRALDGLDLRIRKGEVFGLLGPNGSGKTTAIRCWLGLTRNDGGTIEVLGRSEPQPSRVGYMPQDLAVYREIAVEDNVLFHLGLQGIVGDEAEERLVRALELVDLRRRRHSPVHQLSGGMQHRVSLACAMAHEPELLFLDEPTVGVDPELRENFWAAFNSYAEGGKTLVITTHYMDEARHCHRVGFLRAGKLLAVDTPRALMELTGTDNLEDAFLTHCRRKEGPDTNLGVKA